MPRVLLNPMYLNEEGCFMNAQKFTQKSLEAIQEAQNLAIENNNMQIEEEHLVAALLQQRDGLIPQLLKKMHVTATPSSAQWRKRFPASQA